MKGGDLGLGGGVEAHDGLLGEVDLGTLRSECIEQMYMCETRCLGEKVG